MPDDIVERLPELPEADGPWYQCGENHFTADQMRAYAAEAVRAALATAEAARPATELTHDKIFSVLLSVAPEGVRLPKGWEQFARALERAVWAANGLTAQPAATED